MKIEVTAYPRTLQGSGASRRLRVTGRVPGIVYGADKPAQDVELDHKELLFQLKSEAFHSSILDLAMGGEKIGPMSSPLLLDPGELYAFVVPALSPGKYPLYCLPHVAQMRASLIVDP